MSFPAIASMLSDKGVIDKPTWFRLYAMWEGDTTNVKTGKYADQGQPGAPSRCSRSSSPASRRWRPRSRCPRARTCSSSSSCSRPARSPRPRELEALARDKDFLGQARHHRRHRRGLPVPRHLRVPRQREAGGRAAAPDHAPPGGVERARRQAPARRGEAQGQARLDRSRRADDGVDRREGGGRSGRAAADRAGVRQPADARRASSRKRLETDPTIRYGCMVPVQKSRGVPAVGQARSPAPRAARRQGQPVQHVPARRPAAGPDRQSRARARSRRCCRPTAATTSTSSRRTRATTRSRARFDEHKRTSTSTSKVGSTSAGSQRHRGMGADRHVDVGSRS